MLAIVISLLCAGFVLFRELLFKHSGLRRWKDHKQVPPSLVRRSVHSRSPRFSCLNPIGADWSGLERTSAPPRQAEMLYLPRPGWRSRRCKDGTPLSCSPPPIGEDGELAEPEAPDATPARPQLPALPARAELRDAEVHAMLGKLDFGECAVMGDATTEERQAIANFDIRAFA